MRVSWPSLVSTILGIVLWASPDLFDYRETLAATSSRLLAPAILFSSMVGLWEITAAFRWVSVFAGFLLLLSPVWLIGDKDSSAEAVHVVMGWLVLGVSLLPFEIQGHYGGGWRALRRSESPNHQPVAWK